MSDTLAQRQRDPKLALVTRIEGLEVFADEHGKLTDEGVERFKALSQSAFKQEPTFTNTPEPGYRSVQGQLVPRVTRILNPDEE